MREALIGTLMVIDLLILVWAIRWYVGRRNARRSVNAIPPMPNYAPTNSIVELVRDNPERHDRFCLCWDCFEAEAIEEAMAEFNELFNSYEVKRAKNGALMIRRGDSGSYRFCKKA